MQELPAKNRDPMGSWQLPKVTPATSQSISSVSSSFEKSVGRLDSSFSTLSVPTNPIVITRLVGYINFPDLLGDRSDNC